MTGRWQGQPEDLGPPEIELAGFQFWVRRRQFPDKTDYWDGNWIDVAAHCSAAGADVWLTGPCVHLPELLHWRDEAVQMHQTLVGAAILDCMEPNLRVELKMQSLGQIMMTVHITPEHMTQQHSFEFAIDQSYLPVFLRQCGQVLDEYPICGQQPAKA
jgi:hypothetical protein